MSVISQLVQRADSWVNAMTGLGTLRDKLMHAQVVPGTKLSDSVLEALFNDDDVARRVVAKLPREATRRGFKLILEGDPKSTKPADVAREMDTKLRALGALPSLRDGWIWARLYGGGSGVFVGADDGQSVDQPLNEAAIRTISFLNIVKRPQLSVKQRYEDIEAPEYGKPEIYTVSQAAATLAPRTGLEVHASRLILFDGALTARMTQDSPSGFDDSVLQNAMAPLQQTATAWQSVAHLMTDASQGVLKIANLVDMVAAGGQETLRARIQLMDLARSVCRSILIDAEKESFERISTSFAGLPEVMDKLMMRMSAAAEQPVTLLYGRSAAGMNATGESDIRGWYDTVVEGQTDELKPRLERLLTLLFLAKDSPTRGALPEDWAIEFCPLWQPTDKELADTKKTKADTYVALVGAQIMTDAEAGIGLAPDFPTIDVETRTELAEADKKEGLRPREVNTPEPEPEPDAPGGKGGGGGPTGPKARSDAQAREPGGSPKGGQFAPTGGATPAGRAQVDRRIEQELGGATRRHDNVDVVVMAGTDFSGGAAHDARTGQVYISEHHAALLGTARPAKAGKLQEAHDYAAHVFVHEALHAHGPYADVTRRASHPVLEEVTTDLVASSITGHAPVYARNVQAVKDAISQSLGVDDAAAHQIATDASRRYKAQSDSSDEPHQLFARLAATDPTKAPALAAHLARMGGGAPHDEPENRAMVAGLRAPVRAWFKKQPRTDAQARIPAGGPGGGRWTSSGGQGGAVAAAVPKATSAHADVLTDAQREGIRKSLSTGKNAAVAALQAKIVQRYGVPLAKAAMMYERDIKLQLKAAKAGKGKVAAPVVTKPHPILLPQKPAAAPAPAPAPKPPAPAPPKPVDAKTAYQAKKAAILEKSKATKAANKAKLVAQANALGVHVDVLKMQQKLLKDPVKAAEAAASIGKSIKAGAAAAAAKTKAFEAGPKPPSRQELAHAKELGFDKIPLHSLKTISTYGKDPKTKAAAAAQLKVTQAAKAPAAQSDAYQAQWKKIQGAQAAAVDAKVKAWGKKYGKTAEETAAFKAKLGQASKMEGALGEAPSSAMGPTLGKMPITGKGLAAKEAAIPSYKKGTDKGTDLVVLGPLKIGKSPHQAKFEEMAKNETAVFNVIKGAVGTAHAQDAYHWGSSWVGRSTDKLAKEALDGIDKPGHHLHAQYHATQALLKQHMPTLQKAGIVDEHGYVTTFRGVKGHGSAQGPALEKAFSSSKDGTTNLDVRGTSSWTASHEVARTFAGIGGTVVQQKIHVSNAIAVHHFEPKWGLKEIEWVLIARDKKFKVARANEGKVDPYDPYRKHS